MGNSIKEVHMKSNKLELSYNVSTPQLSSIKVLTNKLVVSLMIVVKVSENLEENGLIFLIQGKGSFVKNKSTDQNGL